MLEWGEVHIGVDSAPLWSRGAVASVTASSAFPFEEKVGVDALFVLCENVAPFFSPKGLGQCGGQRSS
jgi:hypothetical protein